MNKDKQIKKIPDYSLKGLNKYSKLLHRRLVDTKTLKQRNAMMDFLEQTRQSNQEQAEIILRIWKGIVRKPNEDEALKEKAVILARLLVQTIRHRTEGFSDWGDVEKEDNSIIMGELFIEIASVYISFINKTTSSILSDKDCKFFIDTFQEEFVVLALQENYKENADLMFDAFVSDLNKCLDTYDQLPFFPKEDKSEKGTLLWEFAKNVARIVGKDKSILFIELVKLAVLRDFYILQLEKLI